MVLRNLPESSSFRSYPFSSHREHQLFVQDIHLIYDLENIPVYSGIISFLKGQGNFNVNDRSYTVDSSNYLLVSSGSTLSMKVQKNSIPIMLFFATDRLQNLVDFSLLEQVHIDHSDGMLNSLSSIYSLSTSCASFQALKADLLCRNLLERLSKRAVKAEREANLLPLRKRRSILDVYRKLDHAREWLNTNYSENIDLKHLAGMAMMNTKHFLRMFHLAFGITPRQYLIQIRLTKAKEMLLSSTNVSAICRLVGYESLPSFSYLFKKRFGCSPSDFRNQS